MFSIGPPRHGELLACSLTEIGGGIERADEVVARGERLSANGGARRRARIRMHAERYVTKHDAHAALPLRDDRREGGVGAPAEWTLKVREGHDRDGPARRARELVTDGRRYGCTARHEEQERQREEPHANELTPSRIDACLAKVPPLLDSCFETIDLVLRAVETLRGCQSFEGSLADGAPCERDSQCKPAIGADESSGCNDDTKACRTTKILADGAACSLAKGTPSFCGRGLFCDAMGAALTGTCKKATPVGTPCDAKATPSLECGLGNYCDESTALCAIGKGSGASCKTLLECASLRCEDTGGKKCTAPRAIVDVDECKGP